MLTSTTASTQLRSTLHDTPEAHTDSASAKTTNNRNRRRSSFVSLQPVVPEPNWQTWSLEPNDKKVEAAKEARQKIIRFIQSRPISNINPLRVVEEFQKFASFDLAQTKGIVYVADLRNKDGLEDILANKKIAVIGNGRNFSMVIKTLSQFGIEDVIAFKFAKNSTLVGNGRTEWTKWPMVMRTNHPYDNATMVNRLDSITHEVILKRFVTKSEVKEEHLSGIEVANVYWQKKNGQSRLMEMTASAKTIATDICIIAMPKIRPSNHPLCEATKVSGSERGGPSKIHQAEIEAIVTQKETLAGLPFPTTQEGVNSQFLELDTMDESGRDKQRQMEEGLMAIEKAEDASSEKEAGRGREELMAMQMHHKEDSRVEEHHSTTHPLLQSAILHSVLRKERRELWQNSKRFELLDQVRKFLNFEEEDDDEDEDQQMHHKEDSRVEEHHSTTHPLLQSAILHSVLRKERRELWQNSKRFELLDQVRKFLNFEEEDDDEDEDQQMHHKEDSRVEEHHSTTHPLLQSAILHSVLRKERRELWQNSKRFELLDQVRKFLNFEEEDDDEDEDQIPYVECRRSTRLKMQNINLTNRACEDGENVKILEKVKILENIGEDVKILEKENEKETRDARKSYLLDDDKGVLISEENDDDDDDDPFSPPKPDTRPESYSNCEQLEENNDGKKEKEVVDKLQLVAKDKNCLPSILSEDCKTSQSSLMECRRSERLKTKHSNLTANSRNLCKINEDTEERSERVGKHNEETHENTAVYNPLKEKNKMIEHCKDKLPTISDVISRSCWEMRKCQCFDHLDGELAYRKLCHLERIIDALGCGELNMWTLPQISDTFDKWTRNCQSWMYKAASAKTFMEVLHRKKNLQNIKRSNLEKIFDQFRLCPQQSQIFLTSLSSRARIANVIEVFVANPNKPRPISDILNRNREKMVDFLSEFHNDRTDDEQFNDEKAYLIKGNQSL